MVGFPKLQPLKQLRYFRVQYFKVTLLQLNTPPLLTHVSTASGDVTPLLSYIYICKRL